jgi:hypothetical protein
MTAALTGLSRLGRSALAYAGKLGWLVFPCQPRDKAPLSALVHHGFKDATNVPEQICAWWTAHPDANIGLDLGRSGLVAVDVDRHGGVDGFATLASLERANGPLPDTPRSLTGGGGMHAVFARPDGARMKNGSFAPGVELKTAGGYIVLPPSTHPSGQPYVWDVAHHVLETPIARLPAWICTACAGEHAGHARTAPITGGDRLVHEGERDTTLASLAGALRRHGAKAIVIEAALLSFNREQCVPPMPDREVSRIARSISRYAPARRETALDARDALILRELHS